MTSGAGERTASTTAAAVAVAEAVVGEEAKGETRGTFFAGEVAPKEPLENIPLPMPNTLMSERTFDAVFGSAARMLLFLPGEL